MTDSSPEGQPELAVENALLTNEVAHLRSRLADVEGNLEKTKRRLERAKAAGNAKEPAAAPAPKPLSPEEQSLRELEGQALDDIHWLVQRLENSPLIGQLLRTRGGFQTLRTRYAEDPAELRERALRASADKSQPQ